MTLVPISKFLRKKGTMIATNRFGGKKEVKRFVKWLRECGVKRMWVDTVEGKYSDVILIEVKDEQTLRKLLDWDDKVPATFETLDYVFRMYSPLADETATVKDMPHVYLLWWD